MLHDPKVHDLATEWVDQLIDATQRVVPDARRTLFIARVADAVQWTIEDVSQEIEQELEKALAGGAC